LDAGNEREGERVGERDQKLVAGLRAGDENAFADLFDMYYTPMVGVARRYVATREAAEDAVQETFAAVFEGIDRFEGRSSLKTWIFRILVNRAISRGEKEGRSRPFSSLAVAAEVDEPVVDLSRFHGPEFRWAGFWAAPPSHNFPEEQALRSETAAVLASVIDELPPQQALVISLRDVQDMSADDVCELLGISEGNQRVLLHRARAKCRNVLERHGDLLSGAVS
jgi:RNA polymerase sigma-70 factor (ECF subfamily)